MEIQIKTTVIDDAVVTHLWVEDKCFHVTGDKAGVGWDNFFSEITAVDVQFSRSSIQIQDDRYSVPPLELDLRSHTSIEKYIRSTYALIDTLINGRDDDQVTVFEL